MFRNILVCRQKITKFSASEENFNDQIFCRPSFYRLGIIVILFLHYFCLIYEMKSHYDLSSRNFSSGRKSPYCFPRNNLYLIWLIWFYTAKASQRHIQNSVENLRLSVLRKELTAKSR